MRESITAPYIPMECEDFKPDPAMIRVLETIKRQTRDLFDERREVVR